MKILKLTCENVKKLRAIEITPTGAVVEITGKNGAGKSSILDSIWWALAGAKHIQTVPIRRGAKKARIRLDLGELIVERRFTESGSTLTVEKADGARYASPQGILDALLGALAFDPLAFVTQEPRQQFDMLRSVVPLDVDLDNLDALNRGDFERRTEIGRDARTLRAQADGITVAPDDLPAAPVDVTALKDRLAGAAKTNAEIEQRRGRREQAERDIAGTRQHVLRIRAESHALRRQADAKASEADVLEHDAETLQRKLEAAEPLPPLVDADVIRRDLDAAERTNRQIERREEQARLRAAATEKEQAARELTERMVARDEAKATAIKTAKMPIEGLGFGAGIVTYDGVPFDQAETSAQLRVGVALAMAMNPKLRVIRIKEGSVLDEQNLALIAAMAREHDYQIWIETIQSDGRAAVVIEDGSVMAVNAASTDAEATAP